MNTPPLFDLVLVSCSGSKLNIPSQAQHLYTSDLFTKSKDYALSYGKEWAILSALHGLVLPTQTIAPYDLTLASVTPSERLEWDDRVVKDITNQFPSAQSIAVLAGKNYLGWRQHIDTASVTLPLEGMGIGQRLQFLKKSCSLSLEQITLFV